jgi:type I restriction enzyme, R subunit
MSNLPDPSGLTPTTSHPADPVDPGSLRLSILHTLCAMGWQYLSPAACREKRFDLTSPLLPSSLLHFLQQQRFSYLGRAHSLTPGLIEQVMRELRPDCKEGNWVQCGLTWINKLLSGIGVHDFTATGQKVPLTIPLIDWDNWKNNQFEVSECFPMQTQHGALSAEVSLVCFVNGIPLCLIGVHESVEAGIARHLESQPIIPNLYAFVPFYVALDQNSGTYGTWQSAPKFWARWREEEWSLQYLLQFKQADLPVSAAKTMFVAQKLALRQALQTLRASPLNAADQLLIGMLHPQRLLDIVQSFMLFDARHGRLVARSHQYFAVKRLMARLETIGSDGQRNGGVVWHTTGSGKSLTMVLLINALRRHPVLQDCRVIVVTDRIDLQDQLTKKFTQSGSFGDAWLRRVSQKARVRSAHDLARRINNGSEKIIFSLVHKFNEALLLEECISPTDRVIVLVDEAHRSHGGQLHQHMRRVFKRAALVAFTGTPLLKEEKTVRLFGPILHAYGMQRALQDQMVTPLIYEERVPELEIDSAALAQWHRHQVQNLSAAQYLVWQRRLNQKRPFYQADARLELIAWDIALHFHANFKQGNPGLKGMLAANSKLEAIRYQQFLDQTGLISSAIIMSPPDAPDDQSDPVANWWREHVGKRQAWYENNALNQFASEGELDILIVVDRLLTGFDQARVAVLYIDKLLQGHSLMQAIARVNRLHAQKNHGMLVDYRGILKPLDIALRSYSELEVAKSYDQEDLADLYASFGSYCQRLPLLLEQLDPYGDDPVAARIGLQGQAKQQKQFLQRWREFDQCLRLAISSRWFFDDPEFSAERLQHYRQRQQFFSELAQGVRHDIDAAATLQPGLQLYSMAPPIKALQVRQERASYVVDHIRDASGEPEMTDWNEDKIRHAAETIGIGLQQSIKLEMDDDPYAQQVLGNMVQRRLAELHARADAPLQQYRALRQLQQQVSQRVVHGFPPVLQGQRHASAYYGLFLLAQGDAAATADEAERESWAAQALNMANWIRDAVLENSLNQAGLEEMMRGRLLRELFVLFAAKRPLSVAQLRELLERLVKLVRRQVWNKSF